MPRPIPKLYTLRSHQVREPNVFIGLKITEKHKINIMGANKNK